MKRPAVTVVACLALLLALVAPAGAAAPSTSASAGKPSARPTIAPANPTAFKDARRRVAPSTSLAPAARPITPVPVVTSLSRYNGAPGTRVMIYGTNFGAQKKSSIVWFNGVRAKFNSWSDTLIEFTVPADVGAGYVGIENEYGCSNGFYFIPFDAPVIGTISADIGPVGSDITITGSLFGTAQGVGYVSFNGVNGTVKSWSDTQVVVTVPPGATTGYIGLVQNGISSNGMLFTPYYQPRVAAISAQYALIGDQITLTGTDFGTDAQEVVLNGARYQPDSWTDTSVTFTVPQGAASGYCGVVRDGVASNGLYLFVAPRIDSASSWWASPGTQVTVTGRGFGASEGAAFSLLFGGQQISADAWSDTSVTFTVPLGASSGYIGFSDWQRAATSNGYWLLVIDQAVISSVSAPDVACGQTFSVQGTGFGPAGFAELLLNGSPVQVVSWTDTEIIAVAPSSTSYGYLSVRKSGVDSNGMLLNVYDPASVATVRIPSTGEPGTDSAVPTERISVHP